MMELCKVEVFCFFLVRGGFFLESWGFDFLGFRVWLGLSLEYF